jgi:hypothetical protein
MSTSLLAAKLVEAAKKRSKGKAGGAAQSAARAILTAIEKKDENALARALSNFSDISSSPPADDEDEED